MPRTRAAAAAATAAAVPKGDSKANGHANGHTQQAIRYRTIGHRGRAALLRYKYSAVDRSIIAPYLQPLWTRVVDLIPAWVAPNCVTTSGLALVVLSSALAYLHSPHLDAPLPTWVLLAHAALVFTYQTLDAVDGKQVRKAFWPTHASFLSALTHPRCRALLVPALISLAQQARRTGSSGPLGASRFHLYDPNRSRRLLCSQCPNPALTRSFSACVARGAV